MSTNPLLIGIVMVLFTASCSDDQFNLFGKEEILINAWVDPWESNCEGDNMFFKPAGSGVFCSDKRNHLELLADGRAHYEVFSPRDPHRYDFITSINGSWLFDPEMRTLQILDTNGRIRFTFQVHSISKSELVLSYKEDTGSDLPK